MYHYFRLWRLDRTWKHLNDVLKTSNDFIILLLDNSSTHKAKKLVITENIALLFLLPYSPELNPIERLWQHIKSKLTYILS
ncbi:TPA: hypothetical protein ENS27_04725 [bacterium]|nr:hypothetical protein [bacterium]